VPLVSGGGANDAATGSRRALLYCSLHAPDAAPAGHSCSMLEEYRRDGVSFRLSGSSGGGGPGRGGGRGGSGGSRDSVNGSSSVNDGGSGRGGGSEGSVGSGEGISGTEGGCGGEGRAWQCGGDLHGWGEIASRCKPTCYDDE